MPANILITLFCNFLNALETTPSYSFIDPSTEINEKEMLI